MKKQRNNKGEKVVVIAEKNERRTSVVFKNVIKRVLAIVLAALMLAINYNGLSSFADSAPSKDGGAKFAASEQADGLDNADKEGAKTRDRANDSGESVDIRSILMQVGSKPSERYIVVIADKNTDTFLDLIETSKLVNGEFPSDEDAYKAIKFDSPDLMNFKWSYKVLLKDLEFNTPYSYRVRAESSRSEIYNFEVRPASEKLQFLVAGDVQIGAGSQERDKNAWINTLDKSFEKFGTADFILSVGDQVNVALDETEYEYFKAPRQLKQVPIAVSVGNHDTYNGMYSSQYEVPNKSRYGYSIAGEDSYDYSFVYGEVLFMVLNSNNSNIAAHKAFIEQAKNEYKSANSKEARWEVVVFHHAPFSSATHADDLNIVHFRNNLSPVLSELGIDVVLNGHDHVYTRSYLMDGKVPNKGTGADSSKLINPSEEEVLYITHNTASGCKFYGLLNSPIVNYAAVKNQERVPNISNVEVTNNSFKISTYRTTDMTTVDEVTIYKDVDPSQVDSEQGGGENTGENPANNASVYEAVGGEPKTASGFYNDKANLELNLAAHFETGTSDKDGAVTEIIDYSAYSNHAYVSSGKKAEIISIDLSKNVKSLAGKGISVHNFIDSKQFEYGDISSLKVAPDGKNLAVAIAHKDYSKEGLLLLFAINEDGNLSNNPRSFTVGVQPDAVVFTPDGKKLLTADEGEPREGIGKGVIDPKGSVSIVDIDTGKVKKAYFDGFDSSALAENGVLISKKDKKLIPASTDLEPEFIALKDDNTAYVSLQEANAIAVLDIANAEFTAVHPLGFKDFKTSKLYLDEKGANYDDVLAAYMPDGISYYSAEGKDYILTANEGDARDFGKKKKGTKIDTEKKIKIGEFKKVRAIDKDSVSGAPEGKEVLFGGRSFSIFEVKDTGLEMLYDSKSEFEETVLEKLPAYFNASNDDISTNDRSLKKGPEPEYVELGKVGKKNYAFIALERIGGVMVYDITEPQNSKFVNYINSRDFSQDIAGDVSPEGLKFVKKSENAFEKDLILAAFEVSGSVGVYDVSEKSGSSNTGNSGGSDGSGTSDGGSGGGTSGGGSSSSSGSGSSSGGGSNSSGGSSSSGSGSSTSSTSSNGSSTESVVTDSTPLGKLDKSKDSELSVKVQGQDFEKIKEKLGKDAATLEIKELGREMLEGKLALINKDLPKLKVFEMNIISGAKKIDFQDRVRVALNSSSQSTELSEKTLVLEIAKVGKISSTKASFDKEKNELVFDAKMNTNYALIEFPFNDIDNNAWYHGEVAKAYFAGIMNGISENSFDPKGKTQRAMLVTVIHRLEGSPEPKKTENFTDVEKGAYYEKAVSFAKENGIVDGYANNTFKPKKAMSREEMLKVLYNYAKYKGIDLNAHSNLGEYKDAKDLSPYAIAAMNFGVANGIVKGDDNGNILPKKDISRSEFATLINRFIAKLN